MKQIDIDQLCKDVNESPSLNNILGTINELVDRYSLGLRALLDKHAPIIQESQDLPSQIHCGSAIETAHVYYGSFSVLVSASPRFLKLIHQSPFLGHVSVNLKLVFFKVVSSHPHYLTFTLRLTTTQSTGSGHVLRRIHHHHIYTHMHE